MKDAFRSLSRDRGALAGLVVLCLGLGLGVNASLLSVLDLLFFAGPAGVESPRGLHRLAFTLVIPGAGTFSSGSTSYPNYADLRAGTKGFSELAAYSPTEVTVGRGAAARKASAALVSGSFFPLLGAEPALGRLFADRDPIPAAVLSDRFARQLRAGERPQANLGARIVIGNEVYLVVGILPPAFTGIELSPVDVWLPLQAAASQGFGASWKEQRGASFLEVLGRLAPGASPRRAILEASAVFQHAVRQDDPQTAARVALRPVQRVFSSADPADRQIPLWLAGASTLVLLIACANAVSLLFARNLRRRREMATRLALGAGRGRLIRQLLAESALLAVCGGVAAVVFYFAGLRLVQSFLLPPGALLRPGRNLLLLAGLLPAATLLSGLVPALRGGCEDLGQALRGAERRGTRSSSGLLGTLVFLQAVFTLPALAGAGLFLLSLRHLATVPMGMEIESVDVVTLETEGAGFSAGQIASLYHAARDRLLQLPAVRSASLAAAVPFAGSFALALVAPGREIPQMPGGGPYVNAVSADYFRTLGTRISRGRVFRDGERAPIAVVNQTMARLVWPGTDPIGQCLRVGGPDAPCSTVVGVVEDTLRSRLREEATPQYYLPLGQGGTLSPQAILVRIRGRDSGSWSGPIRRQVLTLSPNLPYVDVFRLADLVAPQMRPWQTGALVFGLFGALALLLAALGIYGAAAQATAQRSWELSIRFALGAQWRDGFWAVARPSLLAAAAGTLVGLGATLAVARFLQPLLFEVSAYDARALCLAALVLIGVAWLAAWTSARRVRRIEPAQVLRQD